MSFRVALTWCSTVLGRTAIAGLSQHSNPAVCSVRMAIRPESRISDHANHVNVDRAAVSLEVDARRQAGVLLLHKHDAITAPRLVTEDLKRLLALLARGAIRPRVAERIPLDEVAEAHRRLETGGLDGKLVLCPHLPFRRAPQCQLS